MISRTMQLDDPFNIGNVKVRNRVFLAPMTGVSDLPFRKLAWEYGAGMVVSEMVASEAFLTGQTEYALKSEMGDLPVHMVQLVGRQAQWMAEAAKVVESNGADIVDINMGCPARKVTNGYSGSALMRDLDHALRLIEAVVDAVDVPVTLKMRLGWDEKTMNAAELARLAEGAGVQMITVHGRTRCQFYKGVADWKAIRAVKDGVVVPVLANGDIVDRETASQALEQSGADGIMVGRACYGAPQIAGSIVNSAVDEKPALDVFGAEVERHYQSMVEFYGDYVGVRRARKHLGWYFAKLGDTPEINAFRGKIMREDDPKRVVEAWREAVKVAQNAQFMAEAA